MSHYNSNIESLQKKLNYIFKNQKLLRESLTHRSVKKNFNNERLEFLGDAVLDLIVGEFLFHQFKDKSEGSLSKMRASLVSETAFFKMACSINLGEYIYLSPSQEYNGGRNRPSILSDAFEALMGVIYLESGIDELKRVFYPIMQQEFNISEQMVSEDYKSALQEFTQEYASCVPNYVTISEDGPDHEKTFMIEVTVNGKKIAQASGSSKKNAQQKAAKLALEILKESFK
ncbi:ribonuclease III [Helicobacter muridarum]|uniref:Ribonuclease 3 n=1 Tax=Helicobacter muridarum TaxID=216 RepID=A0A099TWD2_9HELI|nr:ribonuclease III [Helicobacter muridarum]TLD99569.1 ribonuclease III [Helicobacter muridarum]STQ85909.1 ribonuclease III [Helicobacter muridarum]